MSFILVPINFSYGAKFRGAEPPITLTNHIDVSVLCLQVQELTNPCAQILTLIIMHRLSN